MQLSKNFTLLELTNSVIAKRDGIENVPNADQVENLRLLCVNVLQPVRDLVGVSVRVSSGFRAEKLNGHKEIKGSRTSQHLKGQAADINAYFTTPKSLFEQIVKSNIPFDQIILEFDEWVHISYSERNRRQALIAIRRRDGRVAYKKVAIQKAQL